MDDYIQKELLSSLDLCLQRNAIFFITRLGLHPVTRTASDRLVFEPTVVDKLHQQIATTAARIANEFSFDELKRHFLDRKFRDRLTKPLLDLYGWQIWGFERDHLIPETTTSLYNSEDEKTIKLNVCCWIMSLALRSKKNTTSIGRRNVEHLSPDPEPASPFTGISESYQTFVSQAASSMNPQAAFNVPVANMYAQSLQAQSSPRNLRNNPPSSPEQSTSQILSPTYTPESEDELLDTQYCRDNIAQDPTYQPEMSKGRKRLRKNAGTGKKVVKVSKPSQKKVKGRAVNAAAQNNLLSLVSRKDWDDTLHVPNFPTLSLNNHIASLPNQKECEMQVSDNIPPTRTPVPERNMNTNTTILPHRQVTAVHEAEQRKGSPGCQAQAEPRIPSPILEEDTVLEIEATHSVDSVEAADGNHIEALKKKMDQLGSIREDLGDLLLEQLVPDSESGSNVDYARLHQLLTKLWDADKVKMGRELGDPFQRWIDMHSKVLQFRSMSQYAGQLGEWALHRQRLANPMERVMALKAERALKGWMRHNSKELEPHTSDLAKVLCKLSDLPDWFKPDDLTGFIVTHNQKLITWLS